MNTIKYIIPFGSSELRQPETLPLSAIFQIDKKTLKLIGTDHTKDPFNIQITEIEKLFEQCTHNFGVKNAVVVIDGRFSPIPDGVSKEECIKLFGEQGYAGYLAKKEGVEFTSVEPSYEGIIHTALNELMIKPEHLASWAFLNFLTYLIQSNNIFPQNIGEQIYEVMKSFSKNYGLSGDVPLIFQTIANEIQSEAKISIPDTIDEFLTFSIKKEELRKAQQPDVNGTLIQNAGAELNRARDYGIFNNILKLQESYGCIFAVLGWNHVISEIPAFQEIGYIKKTATY